MGLQQIYDFFDNQSVRVSGFFKNKYNNIYNYFYRIGNPSYIGNELFIDNKQVEYTFENLTLRFKYLFTKFSAYLGNNVFSKIGLTNLQIYIYRGFVWLTTFKLKNDVTKKFEPVGLFKNCCAPTLPVDKTKGATEWHSYYFLDNIVLSMIHHYSKGSKALVLAFSALMQGYDKCPNQEMIFGNNVHDASSRKLSYFVGALNGLMCITAQAFVSRIIGKYISNFYLNTLITSIVWSPISSAVMCKIEKKFKDKHDEVKEYFEQKKQMQQKIDGIEAKVQYINNVCNNMGDNVDKLRDEFKEIPDIKAFLYQMQFDASCYKDGSLNPTK
ncbi:MAG: hypothetical protein J0G32_04010 [Alphaproteobacteria bacterium]|nr:hypothetical protein [Alphaproteobacteria bacterium]OJV13891.1 MAG: hypothetical protein BGO27_08350 [Alphaproteobacteria bacterium 33-17]